MRRAIETLGQRLSIAHIGLAYDTWAPVAVTDNEKTGDKAGKIPNDNRASWFARLEETEINPDYAHAYAAWRQSLNDGSTIVFPVTTESRLLIGHGNPAPSGVGLTVHHTWGVPVIPGSAIKGILNHYVDAVYGPSESQGRHPLDTTHPEQARAIFQGVTWNGTRIEHGPGEVHRALFGSPSAASDANFHFPNDPDMSAGMRRGGLVFHDAWYVFEPDDRVGNDMKKPFAADVLTPHQRRYYEKTGETWPNDFDGPNPVGFLTVRPKARFLLAISGDLELAELALRLLTDAVFKWGIGGKTVAGYGRIARDPEFDTRLARAIEDAHRRSSFAEQIQSATGIEVELLTLAQQKQNSPKEPAYQTIYRLLLEKKSYTPADPVAVARWLKAQMQEHTDSNGQSAWRPTATKKKEQNHPDHHRTLEIQKLLPPNEHD